MIFHKTKIKGVFVIELELRCDERGYFTRMFCKKEMIAAGIDFFEVAQGNRSHTLEKGMIRGMHYQMAPHAEDKIIQCVAGSIYDVVLDMREDSATFGQWVSEELTAENGKMLLVPKGCAHGFQTLVENCMVQYLVSAYYASGSERGVKWNDPAFGIAWPVAVAGVSEKDANWPLYDGQ